MDRHAAVACLLAALASATVDGSSALSEPRVAHAQHLASKKSTEEEVDVDAPLLATLDQIHAGELVPLDAATPDQKSFDALLRDRVTGSAHPIAPAILELLRTLASAHPGARIEIVSGYRSPKLNEMLRKKGHHVASHSQHSLGHACDFRIVPAGADRALDPVSVEKEIRALGWRGGVGVYPQKDDWFVHADVGPLRSWVN